MAQISTLVLRIVQFLGYFPVTIQKLESPQNYKPSTKQNKISKLFSSTFWCILPSLFYSLLGVSVIFVFIFDYATIASAIPPKIITSRRTFYSALILKSASHLFCSVFIKLSMVYQRKKFKKFFNNFKQLLEFGETFLENCEVLQYNRFERRFHREAFVFLFLATFLSVEMLFSPIVTNGFPLSYIFVYIVPAVLGYFHSIFTVLLVFFLNWYLEILKRISVLVHNRVEYCKNLSETRTKTQLCHSFYFSGRAKQLRPILGCKWITTDSQVFANLYNAWPSRRVQWRFQSLVDNWYGAQFVANCYLFVFQLFTII